MSENDLQRSLGRIEGSQEELMRQLAAITETLHAHEARLVALDAAKNKAMGVAMAVAAFSSFISVWLEHRLFQ